MLTPWVEKEMKSMKEAAPTMTVKVVGAGHYEVTEINQEGSECRFKRFRVICQDNKKTCQCGVWQQTCRPCGHAWAVVAAHPLQFPSFIDHYDPMYRWANYAATYTPLHVMPAHAAEALSRRNLATHSIQGGAIRTRCLPSKPLPTTPGVKQSKRYESIGDDRGTGAKVSATSQKKRKVPIHATVRECARV